jgi:nucleotide-binding universal stress UspA family protein/MFS family permease
MRQGPLAGRYFAIATMVMAALIPYLALSAALGPLTHVLTRQLHMSAQTFSLAGGLGNAAYAVGTVISVQFAQHLPQRRVMIGYAILLVIGSVLEATAQNATMFIIGHVLQGLCTSLLLIAAVPPLAIGFPRAKLRTTAVIMNMCIFGAVALGPLVGGIQANANAWRPLFWIVTGISVIALLLAILTFEDAPPANRESPIDIPAIGLAGIGCFAAFIGAAELTTHRFLALETILPLLGGLGVIVILIVYQCVTPRPLLTIKQMLVSSIPVAGIGVALFAAAASVSATTLTVDVLAPHYSAIRIGLLFLPEVGGAVVTAIALGIVIQRKSVHYLPLFGMISLAAGIAVFRIQVPSSQAMTLVGSGLTGIGLGATVAPALFVAGFSLPSANLQRVFAIVELLRAVAAFMIAPIFVHFAATVGGGLVGGTSTALWIGLALAIIGAVFGVTVYALSGARPQTPDLEAFLEGDGPAWNSPQLLARVRGLPTKVPAGFPADSSVEVGNVGAATDGAAVTEDREPASPNGTAAVNGSGTATENGSGTAAENGDSNTAVNGAAAAPTTNGHASINANPVLIAYDGTHLSALAIKQAAEQLGVGREAMVLTVWAPVDVGFNPVNGHHFDADQATQVRAAADATAAHGAELATSAGFTVRSATVEASPTWKGIVHAAEQNDASLIVMGSHRHPGLAGHLGGGVSSAVLAHAKAPVLLVHPD